MNDCASDNDSSQQDPEAISKELLELLEKLQSKAAPGIATIKEIDAVIALRNALTNSIGIDNLDDDRFDDTFKQAGDWLKGATSRAEKVHGFHTQAHNGIAERPSRIKRKAMEGEWKRRG